MRPFPETGSRSLPLVALALAMLLPSLGTSIANVALPALESAFAASFGQVQWVVLSYLLAVTTLIVGVGRLGDLMGRRQLLLGGIAIFAVASAAAAFAPNLWALVVARAVQGLGAAVMMALAVASVSDVVPKERAGSAIGLLGTVSAIGTALGPSLGGALLSITRWPAVFAVMAGAGLLTFLVALRMLPAASAAAGKASTFDVPGMLLLALALGAHALSTTLDGAHPGVLNAVLVVVAIVGATAFVLVEHRSASPLIRIELLTERSLGAGLISLALVSTIVMATLVVGPFYLSKALGLEPIETGLVMSVGPGVAALAGLPAGRLVDWLGSGRVMMFGLLGIIAGAAFMTVLPGIFGVVGYIAGLSTITTGYALFQAANNTAIMMSAAPDQRGLTSALLGLARNLGLITGASAMGAVFSLGSNGMIALGLRAGPQAGMQITFTLAALLGCAAFGITLRGFARKAG